MRFCIPYPEITGSFVLFNTEKPLESNLRLLSTELLFAALLKFRSRLKTIEIEALIAYVQVFSRQIQRLNSVICVSQVSKNVSY